MGMRSINVTQSSIPPFEEYIQEIQSLWDSRWLTNMGEKHQQLEHQLKNFLKVRGVALLTNGHAALEVIIEAMELGRDGRKKVITTPFTFASTTHAITRMGLTPVLADIKRDDYTIDPESIKQLIDDETCAIVPVHVYGTLCDDVSISAIAKDYGIPVIYDAAHAFGVEKNGISSAALGNASIFSFHATKVFNTIEGGAIAFHDESLYEKINQWKNFGIADSEHVIVAGSNAKMNEFCAAMGLCNLRHIQEEIAKRKSVAEKYWGALGSTRGLELLSPSPEIKHNYAYFPILFTEEFGATRDEVHAALAREDIIARKYFFPLVSDFECYVSMFDSSTTPVAKYVANHILTIPMHADLDDVSIARICNIIKTAGNLK